MPVIPFVILHATPGEAGDRAAPDERLMPQEHIARNRRDTALVILFMFVLMWAMIFAIGWIWGTPPVFTGVLAIVIAGLYVLLSSRFSVKSVLRATKARPVNPEVRAEKLLDHRVTEMAIASGLPKPKVYVQDSDGVNAFATGLKPEESIICVTTGALERLDQEELEGVIAHEMSHIMNRDMRVTTITIGVVGTIALLSEIVIRSLFFGAVTGRGPRGGGGGGGGRGGVILLVLALVLVILAPIFSRLAYLLLSRRREYLADASGAMLSRNPEGLAQALEKIRDGGDRDPVGSRTAAGLYFANPWAGGRRKRARAKSSIWATHPPLDDRIGRLRGM